MDCEKLWVKVRWVIPSQPDHFAERLGWLGDDDKLYEELPTGDVLEIPQFASGFAGWYVLDDGGQGTKKGGFDWSQTHHVEIVKGNRIKPLSAFYQVLRPFATDQWGWSNGCKNHTTIRRLSH